MPVKTLPYSTQNRLVPSSNIYAVSTVIPAQASWQQWLTTAITLVNDSLLVGSVITQYSTIGSSVQLLKQANALLTNALEHTDAPWLVQEVLALVLYYLGQPTKAKELAFKSLNSYEDACAAVQAQAMPPVAPLQGFAALTLGIMMFQQGIYPLALQWFQQVSWRNMPLLLRFDGLEKFRYAQQVTTQLTVFKQQKTLAPIRVKSTGFWQQWFTYFSMQEQWQLGCYGLQAVGMGLGLLPVKNTGEAFAYSKETGHFTVVSACLAVLKKPTATWQQQLRTLKRCIRKTAIQPALWLALGKLYLKAGHTARAQHALEHGVALCPTESLAQLELGHLYQAIGQPVAAAQAYTWAFSTATLAYTKRQAAFALGLLLENIHNTNGYTQEELSTAMPLGVLPIGCVNTLGVLLALLLKQEQEVPFSTSGTPSHLAKTVQQLGWDALAYWYCLQSLASADVENILQCTINLAFVAVDNHQPQEAVYYYRKAIVLNQQQDSSLHNSLGALYLEQLLLIEPAKALFETALIIDEHCATTHYYLGKIYGLQRQWTLAAQAFAKAKTLNIHSKELDEQELETCLHQLYENM